MRQTRSRSTAIGRLGASALGSLDITSLILPLLDFDAFVAFRGTCRDTRAATMREDAMTMGTRVTARSLRGRRRG